MMVVRERAQLTEPPNPILNCTVALGLGRTQLETTAQQDAQDERQYVIAKH